MPRVPRHPDTMRILVVEDERKVASFIRQGLAEEGYAVDVATDGAAAARPGPRGHAYDLICSTSCSRAGTASRVLRALREHRMAAPVLLLTARDSVPDRVAGLDLGRRRLSDEAVRVRRVPRSRPCPAPARAPRREPRSSSSSISAGSRDAPGHAGSRTIELTAREYALLEYFLRNAGRVLTRPMLAEHVWGIDFDPESNVIDVYVGYLRRKIDRAGERACSTRRGGAGYVLRVEP